MMAKGWRALVAIGCIGATAMASVAESESLNVSFTPTTLRLAEILQDELGTECAIDVWIQGDQSSLGRFVNGEVDIALHARSMSDAERETAIENGLTATSQRIGRGHVAVLVNPENPINSIARADLRAIYQGEILNWSELGGEDAAIMVLDWEHSSEIRAIWSELIGCDVNSPGNAHIVPDEAVMTAAVASEPNAIGYVVSTCSAESTKLLAVDEILLPGAQDDDDAYPLAFPILMTGDARFELASAAATIRYVLSEDGQAALSRAGFSTLDRFPESGEESAGQSSSDCSDCEPCRFDGLALGETAAKLINNDVTFEAQPINMELMSKLYIVDSCPEDGFRELWLSTGEFTAAFHWLTDCVQITYCHSCAGEFIAQDIYGTHAPVPFVEDEGTVQTVTLVGKGISLVRVIGCEVSILEICTALPTD